MTIREAKVSMIFSLHLTAKYSSLLLLLSNTIGALYMI